MKLVYVKIPQKHFARLATIDHLYVRGDPRRTEPLKSGERRRVLSCHKCNVSRPNPFVKIKTLEEAWKESRNWPRAAYATGALPGEV